jgi:hypothetical protein
MKPGPVDEVPIYQYVALRRRWPDSGRVAFNICTGIRVGACFSLHRLVCSRNGTSEALLWLLPSGGPSVRSWSAVNFRVAHAAFMVGMQLRRKASYLSVSAPSRYYRVCTWRWTYPLPTASSIEPCQEPCLPISPASPRCTLWRPQKVSVAAL